MGRPGCGGLAFYVPPIAVRLRWMGHPSGHGRGDAGPFDG